MLQWLISIWVFWCVCQPSALAQTAVENLSLAPAQLIDGSYSYPREEIFKLWLVRRDMRSLGDDPLGFSALDSLQKKKISLGLENIPEISLALLRESQVLLEKDKKTEAIKLIEYAIRLSPNMLEPHTQLLKMHLSGKLLGAEKHNAVRTVNNIVKLVRKTPDIRLRWFYNIIITCWAVVFSTLTILLVVNLCRYLPLQLHQTQHRFKSHPPAYIFAFLYLAAFIAAGIALGWNSALVILMLLIWSFVSKLEKGAVVFLLLAGILLSAAKMQTLNYLRFTDGPMAPLLNINSGLDLDNKAAKIKALLQVNRTPEALYSLAVAEKITGRPEVAKELLEQLLKEYPNFSAAELLLANVSYKLKDARKAIDLYRKVSADNPDNLLARFNLGKVYYNEAVLEPGNEALKQAKMIDANEFDRLEELFKQDSTTHLFDPLLDWPNIIKKQAGLQLPQLFSKQVLTMLMILAVILLYALFRVFRGHRPQAHYCSRCGVISCSKCDVTASMSELCSQCHNIYVKKVTIDPELKIKKEQAIRGYQNRRVMLETVTTLFYPGLGSVYHKPTLVGWLQIAFSTLFLTVMLPQPYLQSANALTTISGLFMGMFIFVFVIFYIGSFVIIIKR